MIPLVERQKNLETLAKTALFKDYSIAYHDGTTYNGTDISDREYFQKAYNEDQIAISPPVIRKTDGSVTTMMAAPTKYSGMKYVIYGGLDSTMFSNGLDKIDMGNGSNIIVLDRNGQVIAASDTSLVMNMVNYLESDVPVTRRSPKLCCQTVRERSPTPTEATLCSLITCLLMVLMAGLSQ